jgi:iron(III) transport system permease protein
MQQQAGARTKRAAAPSIRRIPALPAAISLICAIPLISLVVLALGDSGEMWGHLMRNVLPASSLTTIGLVAGVGLVSSLIGVATAWVVSRHDFTGRNFFHWALVLPLAIPTYIAAYAHLEILEYSGPVQTWLRWIAGIGPGERYWFPDIRSLTGAIMVMSLVLYPYVYLASRLVFEMQGAHVLDTSRVLGAGPWRRFHAVALPLARPAIAAGATLAMLEALNDIAAVQLLGVRTLTFSIFDTWLNRSSLAAAAQIALVMMAFVALLLVAENAARGGRRYALKGSGGEASRTRLSGWRGVAAFAGCALPVALGFGAPAWLMGSYASRRLEQVLEAEFLTAMGYSIVISLAAAIIAAMAAFALAASARETGNGLPRMLTRIATLGYAMPGAVLAIGTLYAATAFDNGLDGLARSWLGVSTGLLVSGTAAILVYAYSVRHLAVAHGAVEAGYSRLSPNLALAARTLGRSRRAALATVEMPLMLRTLATAGLMVFVDCTKEISATILLRPFGVSTLATYLYERASRGVVESGAVAAIAIVAIGLVPVIVLSRIRAPSQTR